MVSKIKVYELGKELGQEAGVLVDVIQRLGIDIKNPMSVLGTEEVKSIREYYKKMRLGMHPERQTKAQLTSVTEKRVGATVIRRRAKISEKEQSVPAPGEETSRSLALQPEIVVPTTDEKETTMPDLITPEVGSPIPPQKPEIFEEPKPKRLIQPIIKKVATEQYLGEVVGPKPEPLASVPVNKEETKSPSSKTLPKRVVKEVELVQAEAAKESRRKLIQRQDTVFRSADYLKRELVHSARKKKGGLSRAALKTKITTPRSHKRIVTMGDSISVSEFARKMGVKAAGVVEKLTNLGVTATLHQTIDYDTAVLVAHDFSFEVTQKVFREDDYIKRVDLEAAVLTVRPPVVTIMGHVDHGKTSLLDAIRKTNIAIAEAGGITQHIGAYTVELPSSGKITFIDTPGHEAFTAMRARGAKVTDIVVVVVSAVDGVMPQTLESINHAKAASVPIIVAINKIDLPEGNADRIKQTLAGHGLNPEEWGGDTIYVNVSAKTKQGIDKLLESIGLQAELLELKANFDTPARGAVIESRLDKNRGAIATILIQHGRLKIGDIVASGEVFGKVRAMTHGRAQRVSQATPGEAVEIMGLDGVPNVGDEFVVFEEEKQARELVAARKARLHGTEVVKPKVSLEEVLGDPGHKDELRLIFKTDVQGSAEALKEALSKFPQEKVTLKIIHVGTGGVTESDVMLAAASRAIVVGFNVRPDLKAQKAADSEGVQIRTHNIIYDLLDEVLKLLEGLVEMDAKEKVIGRAEVRNVFHVSKIGTIAGSAITDGKVIRGCFLRLLRDSRVVYEGKLTSLKRFKEDVREVAQGFECGIAIENFNDIKLGDQLEAFVKEDVKGSL